jgi:hypothetical protein
MTRSGDDQNMRRRRTLDDRSAEALLSGRAVDGEPELTAFIAALSAQAVAAPPSVALATLLADGFVPDAATAPLAVPHSPRVGVRRWALQASLGAAACVALGIGAAANDLPAPVQRTVADVVEALTPLTVPRPAQEPTPATTPTLSPTSVPATQVDPDGATSDPPSTRPTEHSDDPRSGTGGERNGQPEGRSSPEPRTENRDGQTATQRPADTSEPDATPTTTTTTPAPTATRSEQPESRQSSAPDGSGSNDPSVPSTDGN